VREFQSWAYEISASQEYPREVVSTALRSYGMPFARFILSELRNGRLRLCAKHFDQLTEHLFDYYAEDAPHTAEIDQAIAELEPSFEPTREDVLREADVAAKESLVKELRALKEQLSTALGR
jgi:hypothetical protein